MLHAKYFQDTQQKKQKAELEVTGSDMDILHMKLAEDCAKEEAFISKKRLSDFKPCLETLKFLSKNDVRPLKKVISITPKNFG